MRRAIVGVMGPGESATAKQLEDAYALGQRIAEQGWVLLTGGRNAGVMHAASRGAKQANGLTIGILPGTDRSDISAAIDIPILTGMGNARNTINVLSSDVVVACGMGQGTASEVALAFKANKPVILLNTGERSEIFFRELAADKLSVAADPEEAIAIAIRFLQSKPT